MEVLNLSQIEFDHLIAYPLPKGVCNTEGTLYVVDKNELWPHEDILMFKRFFQDEGYTFNNKMFTLSILMDNIDNIKIHELVYPRKVVSVNDKIVGFAMNIVKNNINLKTYLDDPNATMKNKLKYLKEIGIILKKVHNIPNPELNNKMFLNDVNDNNFVIDKDQKKLFAVDIDSCKIKDNLPFPSRYLAINHALGKLKDKYPKGDNNLHSANKNTDIYCYVTIILNFLLKEGMHNLSEVNYYKYLEFLKDNNFNYQLLDCFSTIYKESDNYYPTELVEEIPENINEVSYEKFSEKVLIKKK